METLRSPWTWGVALSFTCRYSGYGNRTGKILLQVMTNHRILIAVMRGVVPSAIVDGIWDEINQERLGPD